MKKILAVLMAAILCLPMANSAIKVHTIGDSTMAEYAESNPKRGWGMFLGAFFDPNFVTVNNAGHSGMDTRQFYLKDWAGVKAAMNEGDYLLIQFAHNDEGVITYGVDNLELAEYCKTLKADSVLSDVRGTNPQTTFRDYLRLFISEARALGVTPVLVAPICRAYFQGNTIKRNGQHDLGDKFNKLENGQLLKDQKLPAEDLSMSYVEAMRIVGTEENVPFINLTEATRVLYLSYGQTECLNQLFVDKTATQKDQTHTNALGASLIAREAAQLLKNAGILAEYIDIPTTISANPSSISISEIYTGVAQEKEVLLMGSGLEPASGTLTISCSKNLQVSVDKEHYGAETGLAYAGGGLFEKLYVRAAYTEAGEQKDSVVITSGDIRVVLPVTANVISLAGGSTVKAGWALDAMVTAPLAAVCEGPVNGSMTVSNMAPIDYNSSKVFTDADNNNVTMVRFHVTDEAGAKVGWPANEYDEKADRFIDFAVTAPAGMEIRVTKISLDIAAHSTTAMCCRIRAGVDEAQLPELEEMKNMANATVMNKEYTPTLTIPAGKTLHVRILPWMNSTSVANNKYLGVKNVVIEGMAFDPTQDIESIQPSALKSQKILRNGVLLIERNGATYNAQGMLVK